MASFCGRMCTTSEFLILFFVIFLFSTEGCIMTKKVSESSLVGTLVCIKLLFSLEPKKQLIDDVDRFFSFSLRTRN